MKQLIKVNNSELSYRLNLNYNNVYSRLRMLLGPKASLFADISPKSSGITWFSDDDAEYMPFNEAPDGDKGALSSGLNKKVQEVRKELSTSMELEQYKDEILEVPDEKFIFYRQTLDGYKFILTAWGCKYAHSSADLSGGFISRMSKKIAAPTSDIELQEGKKEKDKEAEIIKPEPGKAEETKKNEEEKSPEVQEKVISEPNTPTVDNPAPGVQAKEKKTQKVAVRVLNQNNKPVAEEMAIVHTPSGEAKYYTSDEGIFDIDGLHSGDTFSVYLPNIPSNQERAFEVEPNVNTYDVFVKKLVTYSPVLFVEDDNGGIVPDHNIKVIINGQDYSFNTGTDGVIQLPQMKESQKFLVIDAANYANTEEFVIDSNSAKTPYHFYVKGAEKKKVGITVLDSYNNPLAGIPVDISSNGMPCSGVTGPDGRAEFPANVFFPGNIPITLNLKGTGNVNYDLPFTMGQNEYTIRVGSNQKPSARRHTNLKWLALIPLLALLGLGGYKLYEKLFASGPALKEMETGVALVKAKFLYYIDTGIKLSEDETLRYYFSYDYNKDEVLYGTFDPDSIERALVGWTGTAFLISSDGLLATNKHVCDPDVPQHVVPRIKNKIDNQKQEWDEKADKIDQALRKIAPLSVTSDQHRELYEQLLEKYNYCKTVSATYDKILKVSDFKVKVEKVSLGVAFVNTIIDEWDDFIDCVSLKSGEPGGVEGNDVAVMQLKRKENDVPKNAFIFEIPEEDYIQDELPDDYDITVIGYNAGLQIADIKNGIHPQAQPGKISATNEKYRIGYSANTIGGSSGSPVVNKRGKLIAIHNSGIAKDGGFSWGVRPKYLKQLVDEININKTKKKK